MPVFCDLLDLSVTHLPEHLATNLSSVPAVHAHATPGGWLMTVPDHTDTAQRGAPEAVAAIWRYARALGCGLVLLTPDAEPVDCLPVW